MKRTTNIEKDTIEQFFRARKENEETFFTHPSYTLEKELLYWLAQADMEKALKALDNINQLDRATLSIYPFRSLQYSLICSCTLFTRAAIEAGVTPEDSYNLSDVYIRKIDQAEDDQKLKEIEYEMLRHFVVTIQNNQKGSYHNNIVDQAVRYIHKHILQALSLKQVAHEIGVTQNYLSSLFHKVVGTPLKEYVNRKKIEESTYFLKYTDSTILDIALLFHFCNQSHYTALFRRFYGITPGVYRHENK